MRWPPDARSFVAAVREVVRATFERHGCLSPVAYLLATRDPDTGAEISAAPICIELSGAPERFAAYLRALTWDLRATMVVQAYEVRMVGPLSAQPARGFEWRLGGPEAKDYVLLLLEERGAARSHAWLASVESAAALGPFAPVTVPRVEGWLSAVFPLVS
jgi:hypothetical protein